MLLGASVYPLSNPIFWSVFAGAAMVRVSALASAFAMSGDIWILLFEVSLSGLDSARCLEVPPSSLEQSYG